MTMNGCKLIPMPVSNINGSLQILPRSFTGYRAVRGQDKPLGRLCQDICCGLADRFHTAGRDRAFAFQSAHERSPEELRGFLGAHGSLAHLQTAAHYLAGIIQEGSQVIVATVVVTDMQDVEWTVLYLGPHRQVGGLDVLLKDLGTLKRKASPPWVDT